MLAQPAKLLSLQTRIAKVPLTAAVVPADFRTATDKPVLKKRNLDPNTQNYRHVSSIVFVPVTGVGKSCPS